MRYIVHRIEYYIQQDLPHKVLRVYYDRTYTDDNNFTHSPLISNMVPHEHPGAFRSL